MGEGCEGDAFRGGESRWGVAQGEERADDDRRGAEMVERVEGAADGGAGVGDVIDHGDAAAADDVGELRGATIWARNAPPVSGPQRASMQ
jgi:hypothetical protein